MLIIAAALVICAAVAHGLAHNLILLGGDALILGLSVAFYLVLRFPKRMVYRVTGALLGLAYLVVAIYSYHQAIAPSTLLWSITGALTSTAILGSVTSAMLLGHWYLVVRGMSIDPLKRLTISTLVGTVAKLAAVAATLIVISRSGVEQGSPLYNVAIGQGIFFWMRVGWGLIGPLVLFPMIWGTVRIRSTMAATGILYVAVVAVVIGEVLGTYLSALHHLPL